jgi:hypothetical protein
MPCDSEKQKHQHAGGCLEGRHVGVWRGQTSGWVSSVSLIDSVWDWDWVWFILLPANLNLGDFWSLGQGKI